MTSLLDDLTAAWRDELATDRAGAYIPDPERPDPADICGLPGSCGAARCTCLRLLGRTR